MLCEICGKNQATINTKTFIGGKLNEKNVCQSCFAKSNLSGLGPFSINDLLKGLAPQIGAQLAQDKTCSTCKTTLRQFHKTGLLGCANCYKEFIAELTPMLYKIHGRVNHAGKIPLKGGENLRREREIATLRRQLHDAIEGERYEQAALLRDDIRALEQNKEAAKDER